LSQAIAVLPYVDYPPELAKKFALLAESESYLARLRAVLWAKL
jgi:hypothetical protein